jgi:aarF domain-containing kinase
MCENVQLVQRREKWAKSASDKNKLWEKAHERNAKRVYNAIVGLEGLWVKAGQYLSTRADVLPNPYIEVLRQLQDSLPPRPLKEVSGYWITTLKDRQDRSKQSLKHNSNSQPLSSFDVLVYPFQDTFPSHIGLIDLYPVTVVYRSSVCCLDVR